MYAKAAENSRTGIDCGDGKVKDAVEAEILDVMDPTSTVGVFKPKAMYLGGGIDFAKDAVSWRGQVEDFFGPSHVVKDERLLTLVTTGDLSYQGLSTPALLNPMRAETVREADKEFQDMFKKWKSNQLTPEEFKIFQEKIKRFDKFCRTYFICCIY